MKSLLLAFLLSMVSASAFARSNDCDPVKAQQMIHISYPLAARLCQRSDIRRWDNRFFSCLREVDQRDDDSTPNDRINDCLYEYSERRSDRVTICIDRLSRMALAMRGPIMYEEQYAVMGCAKNDNVCFCAATNR